MIKIINEVDFAKWEAENDFGIDEDWIIRIPKECIKGATLLSEEEYNKYKNNISKIPGEWWLRTPGERNDCACYVDTLCSVSDRFGFVDSIFSVRPALIIDRSFNFDSGDKFEIGGLDFTILAKDIALCNTALGRERFKSNASATYANDYEKSTVKKYVDNWFNKAYSEYKG